MRPLAIAAWTRDRQRSLPSSQSKLAVWSARRSGTPRGSRIFANEDRWSWGESSEVREEAKRGPSTVRPRARGITGVKPDEGSAKRQHTLGARRCRPRGVLSSVHRPAGPACRGRQTQRGGARRDPRMLADPTPEGGARDDRGLPKPWSQATRPDCDVPMHPMAGKSGTPRLPHPPRARWSPTGGAGEGQVSGVLRAERAAEQRMLPEERTSPSRTARLTHGKRRRGPGRSRGPS